MGVRGHASCGRRAPKTVAAAPSARPVRTPRRLPGRETGADFAPSCARAGGARAAPSAKPRAESAVHVPFERKTTPHPARPTRYDRAAARDGGRKNRCTGIRRARAAAMARSHRSRHARPASSGYAVRTRHVVDILEARELSPQVRLEGRTVQELFCRPSYADGQPMHTAGCALRAGEVDRTAAQNHRINTRTLLNERSTPARRARLAWLGRDGASRRRTAGRGRRAAGLAAREPPRCPYWAC